MHNPSLLGLSILLLSCTSPTLGAPADPLSMPSSPALEFNPSIHPGFNPVSPISAPSTPLLGATATSSASEVAAAFSASSSEGLSSPTPTPSPFDAVVAAVGPTAALASSPTPTQTMSMSVQRASSPASSDTGSTAPFTPAGTQVNLQAEEQPTATWAPRPLKHSQISSSAHKKLASKFKSINPLPSTASTSPSDSDSTAPSSTSTNPLVSATVSSTPPSAVVSPVASELPPDFSVAAFSETRSVVQPTSGVLDDPNPDVRSQSESAASQRARKSAILAAFLILGTLGALGGGVLCFKCGILPCCHGKDRNRRSRASLDGGAEEGVAVWRPQCVVSMEKSIVPGAPPSLSRDSHAPSCSTCPDSMIGMKSGISGAGSSWRVYATNDDGQFEDVTHVLSSDAFSLRSAPASVSRTSYASAASRSPRHSAESTAGSSGSGTQPRSSVHSRTSESGASMTAESYKSCESRYSTPSFDRLSRDGPPSASGSCRSPSPPASVSVLLMTPDQPEYAGLADAAFPRFAEAADPVRTGQLVAESDGEDILDMELEEDVHLDDAQTYGAPGGGKKAQARGAGQSTLPATGFGEESAGAGTVDVGGRTCVLMRG